jgi:hypothetical protein
MCATAMAVRGEICANPVHTRIIADRPTPKSSNFRTSGGHYSPFWCKNKDKKTLYFGA